MLFRKLNEVEARMLLISHARIGKDSMFGKHMLLAHAIDMRASRTDLWVMRPTGYVGVVAGNPEQGSNARH